LCAVAPGLGAPILVVARVPELTVRGPAAKACPGDRSTGSPCAPSSDPRPGPGAHRGRCAGCPPGDRSRGLAGPVRIALIVQSQPAERQTRAVGDGKLPERK